MDSTATESLGDFSTIIATVEGAIATITLNRPGVRNAINGAMVRELLACFRILRGDSHADVRAVVVRANGPDFSAGTDLNELAQPRDEEEGLRAGQELDDLLRMVNEAPQVVVARVQGHALSGGLGLACVSDIVVAGYSARFGLPETRWGLVPAVITPYVVERIGLTTARRLMLTCVLMGPDRALAYGIAQEVCADMELDARVGAILMEVMHCAPRALREAKRLLFHTARDGDNGETRADRIRLLYELSQAAEARQGLRAWTEKTPSPWAPESSL